MRTQHHIRTSTLTDLAAGRLCEAMSVVAASHLAWCRECRMAVEAAAPTQKGPREARRATLPAATAAGQTTLKAIDRLRTAAETAADEFNDFGLPMPLALCLDGCGLQDVAWRKVLPGVAVRDLQLASPAAGRLRLVRLAPGRALPEHAYGSCVLSLVLRGAYRDGQRRFAIGDVADLDAGSLQRPMAEDAGECICLVAAPRAARYNSWTGRLWQRLRGL